jgi:hypothetical protein
MTSYQLHAAACEESRQQYLAALDAKQGALDWQEALKEARQIVTDAIKASDKLRDIAGALQSNGSHSIAFRHLLSPPKGQDQFKLICPVWPKSSEKNASRVRLAAAEKFAEAFEVWRSRRLTPWLDAQREPAVQELNSLLLSVSPLIASQRLATARRNRLAREQEEAVVAMLEGAGWKKLTSNLVEQGSDLPKLHYMHKTKFASGPKQSQEVDVACGLGKSVVLAMECKVTNDVTNSVKRINDILKKAAAWRSKWGEFVRTAAMLQGVMNPDDVKRLLDVGVEVFWSHRLDDFATWIDTNLQD